MKESLETSWKRQLAPEFEKPYFKTLESSVSEAYRESTVFPSAEHIFNAFSLCPFDTVKVVILGQDPYHGDGQAHGLAFSVPDGISTPPSLRNIYKEIATDIGIPIPHTGNLEHWATQGVLLLNASLTVLKERPGSHQKLGWGHFTDAVLRNISVEKYGVVFLLWGAFARAKRPLIDTTKHLVLEAAHPSPLSAHAGFFGCKHFSQTNSYLKKIGKASIDW